MKVNNEYTESNSEMSNHLLLSEPRLKVINKIFLVHENFPPDFLVKENVGCIFSVTDSKFILNT